jgi:hypothetical protein
VALGEVFVRALRFTPVGIIPPMLHTHFYLHVGLTRRTKGRSLGMFRKAVLFTFGKHWTEEGFHLRYNGLPICTNYPSLLDSRLYRYFNCCVPSAHWTCSTVHSAPWHPSTEHRKWRPYFYEGGGTRSHNSIRIPNFQDLAQLTKCYQQQGVGLRVCRRQTEKWLHRTSSSVEFRYISQHISYEYLLLESGSLVQSA